VLDRLGEDIRRRLLLVTAPDGAEMCLRPDFTLPVARHHVDVGTGGTGRYAYAGLAFRFPSSGETTRATAEFRQAGIEHFGNGAREAADAEVLAATLAALEGASFSGGALLLGDVSLFEALLASLPIGDGWRRRLAREFRRHEFARDMLRGLVGGDADAGAEPADAAFADALAGMDPVGARAVVEEVMAIAGAAEVGGRTSAEIAARFVEQARAARDGRPGDDVFAALEAFLAVRAAPEAALRTLTALAPSVAGDYRDALAALERRLGLIGDAGVDIGEATFAADFAGRTGYYTGMVFEVRSGGNAGLGAIASGGRYDGFLEEISGASMPAVGASIYVDRLLAAAEAAT
jgi:ATP phosphoribosyltransferase regulatory subunit